jgi:HPt (histidine-containing phosphotransfer) domain-containing protein
MAQGPGIDELLARARSEFALRLPAKVDELESLASRPAWPELRVAAHKLRGSAATYGFPALSSVAAGIEDLLLGVGCAPTPSDVERILAVLLEARAQAARAAREGR